MTRPQPGSMSYLPPDFTVVQDKNAWESEDVAAAEKASRFLSEDVSCSAVWTFFLKKILENICSFADVSSSSISRRPGSWPSRYGLCCRQVERW